MCYYDFSLCIRLESTLGNIQMFNCCTDANILTSDSVLYKFKRKLNRSFVSKQITCLVGI